MDKKTLLIVDDERDILEIISLIYADDFNIVTAVSGNEAFEIYKKTDINIILTDFKMPNGDGSFLADAITNFDEKDPCPIFMMTANLEYDYAELLEKGVKVVFSKPFDFDQFLKVADFYLNAQNKTTQNERKYPRVRCKLRTEIEKDTIKDIGEMLDITPEGFLLHIPKRLPVKRSDKIKITVKSTKPSIHFQAKAECRWVVDHEDFILAGFFLKDTEQINQIIRCFNHFQISEGDFH